MAALKFPFQVSREERNVPGNQQHDRRKTWNSALLCTVRRSSLAAVIAVTPFALATMLTPIALGQASSSSDAAGKVTDATGATVPGATVHLVNNATGAERAATTNSDGDWSIPNVPPANYKV